ncbi:MAG: pseudaminic acid cytidylyltransferase [Desulfobacteraceae bacterium]|jgi:pseudaminic acid cytidylyltransferase|nr:pseudaminic acid cytidylyltransferase [Desulfobacteraceae bacterium]
MKLCIIPARGGSKRIPRKNIRNFLGKPVIAYSILSALESNLFDAVIVSTDDDEIAEVARQYGAIIPFKRPAEISEDFSTTADVLLHAIEWYESTGCKVSEMTCIYPVNPFVTKELLMDGYRQWKARGAKYCFAVSEFNSAPQRALKMNKDGRIESMYPQFRSTRTQDLEVGYFDAGMFYFCETEAYKKEIPMHSEASSPYVLPRHLAHDIDTEEDWDYAEKLFKIVMQETKLVRERL